MDGEEELGGEGEFRISLDSPNLFIRSPDKTNIWVYELEATPAADSSSITIIRKENWTHLYCVGPNLQYSVLEVLGSDVDGEQLTRLAEDLCYSRLIVNSDGFCFLDTAGIVDSSAGFEYYRLNDIFSWSDYGIDPQSESGADTAVPSLRWNRCNMRTGEELAPDQQSEGDSLEELRREIGSLQDTLEEKEEEIQRLKAEIEKKSKGRNPPPPPVSGRGRNQRPGFSPAPPPPPPPPPPASDQPRSRPTNRNQGQTNSPSPSPPPPTPPPPPPKPRKLAPQPVVEDPNKAATSNRRRVPPIKLRLSASSTSASYCLAPKRVEVAGMRTFLPYNEDVAGLFPRNVTVRWSGDEFDRDNWWYVKAWESGAEVMIGYYEGEMDSDGRGDKTFDIPYRKGGAAFSSYPQCFVGLVRGVGLRFMFVY